MEAKSSKVLRIQQQLLEAFRTHETLTINELCDMLNCSRGSVNNYINRLKENGCCIEKYTRHNHTYYYLNQEKSSASIHFEPITADILRKYTIVRELQHTPLSKKELIQKFTPSKSNSSAESENCCVLLDVQETKLNALLKDLIDSKELELDTATQTYHLTGRKIPLQLNLDYNGLYDLNLELANLPSGSPLFNELDSIYQKTQQQLGCLDYDEPSVHDHYIISGKKLDGLTTIAARLEKLADIDYKKYVLRISYTNKKGEELSTYFALGKIIYVIEKDSLYLLGKNYSDKTATDESLDIIINVARIKDIQPLSFTHDCYNSDYFNKIAESMFSISTKPPVNVVVEFDNFGNIGRKIQYLTYQRRHSASYEIKDNKIIYKDSISGLSDFAAYLRKFGKSVHVIEPQELKDKLEFSVKRTLNRYTEVLENEEL